MAVYWWTSGGSTDANLLSNYNTLENGTGSAPGSLGAGDDIYFSSTASTVDWILTANFTIGNMYTTTADTGGTDNWGSGNTVIDLVTYDLSVNTINIGGISGANAVRFRMGVSSNTGLTCVTHEYVNANTSEDLQNDSKIYFENYTQRNNQVTTNTGDFYTNAVTCNWNNAGSYSFSERRRSLTVATGHTLNVNDSTWLMGQTITQNGTINWVSPFAGYGTVNLTLGPNSDIQGSGIITCNAASVVNNNTGTFSMTGILRYTFFGTRDFIVGDFSNASIQLELTNASTYTLTSDPGTIKTQNYQLRGSGTGQINYDNSINNTNFEISGSIIPGGSWLYNYTKGNGTITLNGNNNTQSCNFGTLVLEDVIIAHTGTGSVQFQSNLTTDSLSGTSGTLESSVLNTARTVNATFKGTMSNVAVQDIHMNEANKVNAKDNCVNNENTKGFVFEDSFGAGNNIF